LPPFASEMARQKPREPEFYIVLGNAWSAAGKPAQAVVAYEQAARLTPDSARVLRSLAMGLSAAGQATRAEAIFKRALAIGPSDPITWYRYGLFESASGHAAEAVEKIRKAIELDPSLPEQHTSLADILAKSGQTEAATAAVRDALRADPYDDAAWDIAGRVLTEKSEMAEAFYDFTRTTRLRPTYAPYLYDFALALIRGDRFDEAQQRAEEAVRADPNLADAHELLGSLFARKRQLAEAVREYQRCLELRPESSRAHLKLANVLAAQGDIAGASEHYRAAAQGNDAAIAQQAAQALRQIGAR